MSPTRILAVSSLATLLIAAALSAPAVADPPFGRTIQIDDTNQDAGGAIYPAEFPRLVERAGTLYSVWQDNRDASWDVYFASSSDGGASWSRPAVQITSPPHTVATLISPEFPALAVAPNGSVYVAFDDHRGGDIDIYLSASHDGGLTWSSAVRVNDNTSDDQLAPSLAVDAAGTVYAFWTDGRTGRFGGTDLYGAQSVDGGLTWSVSSPISGLPTPLPSQFRMEKSVAVGGTAGHAFVAWQENRADQADVFSSVTTNGGSNWTAAVRIDAGNGQRQTAPAIARDAAGKVFIAWEERGVTDSSVHLSSSSDGVAWSAPSRVSDSVGDSSNMAPSIAARGSGRVAVAWPDSRDGEANVYTANSTDSGATWPPATRVTADTVSGEMQVAVALGEVHTHVAWTSSAGGGFHIHFTSTGLPGITDHGDPVLFPWLLVLIVLSAVTAVAIVLFVWLRRRRPHPPLVS